MDAYMPRHRKCPRHDLYREEPCDPHCINPARYYEALHAIGMLSGTPKLLLDGRPWVSSRDEQPEEV